MGGAARFKLTEFTMGDMTRNLVYIEETVWEKIQALVDEYQIISIRIMIANKKKQYALADVYESVKKQLESEISKLLT